MKTKDLINLLEKNGWYLKRNGSNHDVYTDGVNTEPIPRHKEVKENRQHAHKDLRRLLPRQDKGRC